MFRSYTAEKRPKSMNVDWFCLVLSLVYIALPDDIMVKIFMSFTVKDILNRLCLVCKRWKAIWNSFQLWRILPLDNWSVKCLNKGNLLSILAHSSGFECLSINYIKLHYFAKFIDTCFLTWVGNRLWTLTSSGWRKYPLLLLWY